MIDKNTLLQDLEVVKENAYKRIDFFLNGAQTGFLWGKYSLKIYLCDEMAFDKGMKIKDTGIIRIEITDDDQNFLAIYADSYIVEQEYE